MCLLSIKGVSKTYGGLTAVNRATLSVQEGCVNSLIGPNGAGKTTLFNIISCIEKPTSGEVRLRGRNVTYFPSHRIVELGIARTFQNLCLIGNMTVLENVMTGDHSNTRSNIFSAGFRLPGLRRQEKETMRRSLEILDFLGLEARAGLAAAELPYGEQRLLEIARALATRPALLLLDEPAAGLNSKETEILAARILEIKNSGVTVFLVEHDMRLVMRISDEISVLDHGQVIAHGSPAQIRAHPEVIRCYLGMNATRLC